MTVYQHTWLLQTTVTDGQWARQWVCENSNCIVTDDRDEDDLLGVSDERDIVSIQWDANQENINRSPYEREWEHTRIAIARMDNWIVPIRFCWFNYTQLTRWRVRHVFVCRHVWQLFVVIDRSTCGIIDIYRKICLSYGGFDISSPFLSPSIFLFSLVFFSFLFSRYFNFFFSTFFLLVKWIFKNLLLCSASNPAMPSMPFPQMLGALCCFLYERRVSPVFDYCLWNLVKVSNYFVILDTTVIVHFRCRSLLSVLLLNLSKSST